MPGNAAGREDEVENIIWTLLRLDPHICISRMGLLSAV
jgi:hypothetical protein